MFTRVPDRPVPPLPRWASAVLPLADLFMVLLVSRPPTGTLGTTWVTPSTLWLSAALLVLGVAGGGLLLPRSGLETLAGAAAVLLGLGCGSIALVGLAQRR